MKKQTAFEKVTKDTLKNTKQRFYTGGKELKVGDQIIFGFNIMYANLNRTPPSKLRKFDLPPPLSLTAFVLPKNEIMLYQLYELEL